MENNGNENIKVGDILFNCCLPHKPPQYFKVMHVSGRTLTVKSFCYRQIKNSKGRFYPVSIASLFYDTKYTPLPGEYSCSLSDKQWYLS